MCSASDGIAIRVQQFHVPPASETARCVQGPPGSVALAPMSCVPSGLHERHVHAPCVGSGGSPHADAARLPAGLRSGQQRRRCRVAELGHNRHRVCHTTGRQVLHLRAGVLDSRGDAEGGCDERKGGGEEPELRAPAGVARLRAALLLIDASGQNRRVHRDQDRTTRTRDNVPRTRDVRDGLARLDRDCAAAAARPDQRPAAQLDWTALLRWQHSSKPVPVVVLTPPTVVTAALLAGSYG